MTRLDLAGRWAGNDEPFEVAFGRGMLERERWGQAMATAVCVALLVLLFRDNLVHFVRVWSRDENYSHGFLVPLISLYFARRAWLQGPTPRQGGLVLGSAVLVLSLLLQLATIPLPIPFLGDLAFLGALLGGFTLVAGRQALGRYAFAILFLVFMIPLPIALYARIASPLQLLASQAASAVMNATGLPVLCEGNRMTLPGGIQLFVAEACSGMRQLTGFLALTTAMAYLVKRPLWQRAAIVLSALPIALSANIARIVLTGYITYYSSAHYASGAYHTLEGLLMMGLGLALLSLFLAVLDWLTPRNQ